MLATLAVAAILATAPGSPEDASPAFVEVGAEVGIDFVHYNGMTGQLYGPLDAVSAHSGLNWLRPSLLHSGMFDRVGHIPTGFQNMYKALAQQLAA